MLTYLGLWLRVHDTRHLDLDPHVSVNPGLGYVNFGLI